MIPENNLLAVTQIVVLKQDKKKKPDNEESPRTKRSNRETHDPRRVRCCPLAFSSGRGGDPKASRVDRGSFSGGMCPYSRLVLGLRGTGPGLEPLQKF